MFRAAIAAVILVSASTTVSGQESYPSQLVRIMVASLPGSTTDTLARVVAEALKERWQKTVIVDNVGRGGAATGSIAAFQSAPDGYTLLISAPGPVSYNHLIYRGLKYDPTKFTPISLLARVPNVLMMRSDFPASNVRELIEYAKAHPGGVTYASTGIGTTAHLSATMLETLAGVKLRHVPYRGAREATMDIMGGRLDMFFDTAATALPQHRAGKARILAIGSPERMAQASDIPTMAEAGLPGFRSVTWFAMVAPPGLPADLAAKINSDVQAVLKTPEVSEKLGALGFEVMTGTPADASKFFSDEAALWSKIIETNDIHLSAE